MDKHTRTYPIEVAEIAVPFKAILLDAYGVFWGGNSVGPLPGAKRAMEAFMAQGKVVGILSNATMLSAYEIAKVKTHGLLLGVHFHFYLTSGEILRGLFGAAKQKQKFWLFGEGAVPPVFQGSTYEPTPHLSEADFIYIAVPKVNGEDVTDPELFRAAVGALKGCPLPMICPNPDTFAHEGNPPRQVVRQGSIGKMYEEVGGTVFYVGKPSSLAYTSALQELARFGVERQEEVLMVGDTPETDIRGAREAGIKSALLLETGIMADRIRALGLEEALKQLSVRDRPDFFVGRLGLGKPERL